MTVRRFGPTRGAGTRIEEQEGDKTITPGALGFAGYAGLFEKGPVGEMKIVTSKPEFTKWFGGIIDDGQAPEASLDYFSVANGAGGLIITRVTDGNEVSAELTVYARSAAANVPVGKITAKNGGRWGGRTKVLVGDLDSADDLANTTLQLGATIASDYTTDEWKDAYIELDAVSNTRYTVIGSTAAGLLTVASDQTMKDDWTAASAPTNLRFNVVMEANTKNISVRIDDGEEDSSEQFSLEIFLDGVSVKKYGNLHTDPTHARYWVNIINNDDGNAWIDVEDLFTGAHTAATRPANFYGVSTAVAATVLTVDLTKITLNCASGAIPTVTLGTTTDVHMAQTLTLTMTSATEFDVESDKFGSLGTGTIDVEFETAAPTHNKFVPPFTLANDSGTLAVDDVIIVQYVPLPADGLIGGRLWPDKANSPLDQFIINDNDHKTITVSPGADITTLAEIGDEFMVAAPIPLENGRDGNADIADSDYETAWDSGTSPFNNTEGQSLGLIKYGTPGVTSTAVQKAGKAYAEAKNHQYRVEVPASVTTESGALDYINNTIGRSDYAVNSWPSYGNVPDPDPDAQREGRVKSSTLTGQIHGREAAMARDYGGYHKAAAGVEATLPRVISLPTGDNKLDEERLNPAGISVIKKASGNFVTWGSRTLNVDPNWKWKHQREQMSYYEHVLQEAFDWIIFAINDPETDQLALTALVSFFMPEWVKRALRGGSFTDAAIIKIDAELNTDATRGAGDLIAEVSLRLADTVERFIIRIGKQGIFEQVAA
jgi:hypothetical protein